MPKTKTIYLVHRSLSIKRVIITASRWRRAAVIVNLSKKKRIIAFRGKWLVILGEVICEYAAFANKKLAEKFVQHIKEKRNLDNFMVLVNAQRTCTIGNRGR
ncbi:MAG: hypothetical protein V1668_03280 [Patescibacteria group bacterium]